MLVPNGLSQEDVCGDARCVSLEHAREVSAGVVYAPLAAVASLSNDISAGVATVQNPYLYIQAAGSDGSDGSVRGIDLRWALLRSLAGHLPKGNLAAGPGAAYPAAYGFNKTDDFVNVLRVTYRSGLFQDCTKGSSGAKIAITSSIVMLRVPSLICLKRSSMAEKPSRKVFPYL
jgi:hypothetical protein